MNKHHIRIFTNTYRLFYRTRPLYLSLVDIQIFTKYDDEVGRNILIK